MKMKKIICLIALSLAGVSYAAAQHDDETTIRLRNGIEVRGVVEESSSESVTIRTSDGDVFVYRMKEISRIDGAGADMVVEEKAKRASNTEYGNFKGYRAVIELTPYYNTNYGEDSGIHLTMINGYNFGPWFYAGIGVGLNVNFDYPSFSLPVFAHVRSAFLKNKKVSPYVSLNIGYNIGLTGMEESFGGFMSDGSYYSYKDIVTYSGFYAEPAVGVEFRFSRKSALTLGLSAPLVPVSVGDGEYSIYGVGLKVGYSF